jgi:hypothetical protein
MRRAAPILLLLAACGRPVSSGAFTPEHQAAIVDSVTTMLTAWRTAIGSRDANRFQAFYANDPRFRWIEDGVVRYTTPAQIGDAYRATMPGVRALELTLDNPAITPIAPGAALVTTGFAQKFTDTTGAMTGFAGMISMTVIHGDSGWQFLAGHTSSVMPRSAPSTVKSQ